MVVEPLGTETLPDTALGTVKTLLVELKTAHKGQLEQRGRFLLWLTDDDQRVPVKMVVRTNFGPLTAELTSYQPATP